MILKDPHIRMSITMSITMAKKTSFPHPRKSREWLGAACPESTSRETARSFRKFINCARIPGKIMAGP